LSHRYTSTVKVIKDHLDDLNHVNNVQYLLWAQDIAKAHWQKINEIIKDEGVWMVRSHEVEYRLGGFLDEEIRIETYVKNVRGPLSQRVVEFYNNKNAQLMVRCKTQWCYVDLASRKPIKVSNKIQDLFLKEKAPF
jgi:acyl-CoA thioester hydrolase